MTRHAPTFDSKRDYVVYLIGEHKLIVAATIVSTGIIVAFGGFDVTVPAWALAVVTAELLLGIPAYILGYGSGRRIDPNDYVEVYQTNAATDERGLYFIEREHWKENKRVEGPPPRRVNDEQDFEVREFEEMDDIGEIRVEGARFEGTMDGKLATSQAYAEDIHDYLEDAYARYSDVRRRVSQMGMDVKKDTVNTLTEALERGVHPEDDSVADAWERAESDVDSMVDEEIPGLTHEHVEEDLNRWEKTATGTETPGENGAEAGSDGLDGGEL
ncbi:hypothetical protein [Halostella pelagica]|uniref:hypothetical protein n=1 Tax=Halostella pelagica TaxID=2583824 RepID=UPI00108203A2|nr:hypothetical protein [Halostella pelagica]